MAKGSLMIQIAVEQKFSALVTDVPEIWTVAFAALDGDRTVVREIASEKSQAVLLVPVAPDDDTIVNMPVLGISQDVATDVWLAFNDLRRPPAILHAPSHVLSPPIDGAVLALLRVRDFGLSITQHGKISTIRRVGSHVYLEETAA
jgi:hypothetical protein